MAKIGLSYVAVGKLSNAASVVSAATATYTDSKYMGTTAGLTGNVSSNDVKDYGDDRTVETDTSFQNGTLSWEKNDLDDADYAYLLGHAIDQQTNEVLANANDIAPYVGIGVVGKARKNGADVYKAKFYLKVQFHEPNDEHSSKQDSITFGHETIEGNVFMLENGDWKLTETFSGADALDDAKEWVNTKLGLVESGSGTP